MIPGAGDRLFIARNHLLLWLGNFTGQVTLLATWRWHHLGDSV